jgi:ferredoxin
MAGGRWQLSVEDTCIGSAVCAGMAPSYFTVPKDRAVPVAAEVDADEDVIDVALSCPMEAIRVVELDTGRVLAPEE